MALLFPIGWGEGVLDYSFTSLCFDFEYHEFTTFAFIPYLLTVSFYITYKSVFKVSKPWNTLVVKIYHLMNRYHW